MFNTGDRRRYAPEGYEQITGLTSAKSANPPTGSRYAVFTCTGAGVRFRDDGTAPTASTGTLIPVGATFWYAGNLGKIQFFQDAATAILDISYYS